MQKSKRQSIVVEFIKKYHDVQISEIASHVDSSQSTIRRDIKELVKLGQIKEVYGSVIYVDQNEADIKRHMRTDIHKEAKEIIGEKAAAFITGGQFIFIDAGSTTFQMVKHIKSSGCTFVTSGIDIASELLKQGHSVIILGGPIKPITEAVVGEQAIEFLKSLYFDIAFIGTNGVSEIGYSTPDPREGLIKKTVIDRSRYTYVLSDTSKQGKTTSFVFASPKEATLITEQ